MRILYGQGYTEGERKVMIPVIHANLINMTKALISMTEELGGFNPVSSLSSSSTVDVPPSSSTSSNSSSSSTTESRNPDSTESNSTTNPDNNTTVPEATVPVSNETASTDEHASSAAASSPSSSLTTTINTVNNTTTNPSTVSSIPIQVAVQIIKKISDETTLNSTYANYIETIWHHPMVQEAYKSRSKFQLSDAASYFLSRVQSICQPDYVPSVDDVLHTRVRTSGILAEEYIIDDVSFCIYDVGGQRNERRKWIHAFDDVTAIIFVAAISECKYCIPYLYG